ncbi:MULTISPECIES: hypothetical protein [Pseudomonas]|uniref:hypothetical protein n=1 Tax=Pseudomonas TaxID=286 RepID=UPI00177ACBB4|nr:MULTISPECIES: hypothetical protein [Pseudomonas]MBD8614843.1 hypothetical protein [Pseudomonas putida]MBD8681473.1 hypothetical protein [Pseudomonas sp. CFBP 13719]
MPVNLSIEHLEKFANPFGEPSAWGPSVTMESVAQALDQRRLIPQPGGDDHAARIAYLVLNPARDPIHIDVGVPSHTAPAWPILDGNHRLAAAIYRGDSTISSEIGGCLDLIANLFNLSDKELEEI